MVRKKVVWTDIAKDEFRQVLEYYFQRNDSSNYSLKIIKETENLINTLSKSHFIGRITSNEITRVIPMKVYLIFYEVNDDYIEIVSFWDNRQDERNIKI